MSGIAPLLQFALLSGFVLALTIALLLAAAERPLRNLLQRQAPQHRARLTWWLLVAPLATGAVYAAITVAMPSLFHDSAQFAAACSGHTGSWWHACVWHPSDHGQSLGVWVAMAVLGGLVGWLAARALGSLWAARRLARTMLRLSRPPRHPAEAHVLESEQPLALACGVGRGHVVLSQSLLDRLDPLQLRVVLAHEHSHVHHRDVLWRLLARLLSGLHLPGPRRRLLECLELASEQRCDRAAAEVVGSRLAVAETILAVERLFRGATPPPMTAAFSTGFVRERVHALLSAQQDRRGWLGSALAATLVAFAALSAGWLHHFTESLIAVLAG